MKSFFKSISRGWIGSTKSETADRKAGATEGSMRFEVHSFSLSIVISDPRIQNPGARSQ
jgi:hypothetical protein